MNKQKFFKVIDLIDEDIVREAEIKAEALTDAENEKAMTVSGVEKYRKITWQRTAAIASAVLLIAGVGTGGALMLKNRPPLLDEVSNVAVTETTEDMGTKARGSGETAEVTSVGRTAETDTKESKNTTAAEKDKQLMTDAPREESTEAPREENSGEPQEENNEPEGRENVTTTAKPIQPNKTTTTKAQTTQKSTTVTTAIEKTPPPQIVTTEPAMLMNDLTYEISMGEYYNSRYKARGYYCDVINSKYQYTICSGERSTGGYGIRITGVNVLDFGTVIVTVEETAPAPDAVVTCALTYPNCIITFSHELPAGIIIRSASGTEFGYLGNG
ncbi:MAG: protease complex subunit PrcB family protein [Ruminococcus sp.]|nr:protease complex subunit PrcB family protein [Ruminococcus sp.]